MGGGDKLVAVLVGEVAVEEGVHGWCLARDGVDTDHAEALR
jgi:hypothetical protein